MIAWGYLVILIHNIKEDSAYDKQLALALWDPQCDWIRYLAWGHVRTTGKQLSRRLKLR